MANGETWHAVAVDEVLAQLATGHNGLDEEEARRRLAHYGPNELAREEPMHPVQIVLRQVVSPLVYVLFVASIISFVVGHLVDGFVILGVVAVNTVIGFFQEYRAEKAMQALKRLAAPMALVLRNGRRHEIAASDLVPGDIVLLATGDRVPADGRIVDSSSLKLDEAALTGESAPVEKSTSAVPDDTALAERTSMVYAGTTVTYGRGTVAIVATGLATEVGKIAEEVATVGREQTPLQARLAAVGRLVAIIALGLAVLLVTTGLARGAGFFEIFLFAIAAAVAAIPEGLPAVITVVLAIGLQRMAARHAIVRKLPAVETLGSATVICSDKTGTLTKNEMTVTTVYTFPHEFRVTGEGYEARGEVLLDGQKADLAQHSELRLTLLAGALCNDAELRCTEARCEVSGDPTEGALLAAAAKIGLTRRELSHQMPRLDEIPFDSGRAYMATLNRVGDERMVFVKGSPERVIQMCTLAMDDGRPVEFTPERKEAMLETNHDLAARALRVLALACKEAPADKDSVTPHDLGQGLVFLGLAGMIDPPRPEAIDAIKRCRRAGIRVMMATGDNKVTARAIAEQMGILREGAEVVEGRDLGHMSDDEFADRIERIAVFARVEPEHKLRIVNALKRRGQIVAMTGDGVNDAPALKRADIGVAMGITGTDVAKEASEMVLTDDNFASIVAAVEEGRIIFRNIKKVVTYLLSTNAGEQAIIIGTILLGLPLPLVPVQILWINLVTDSFPALALAADPPREDVLAEPPRHPKERIISRGVLIRIVLVALIMAIGTVWLFYWSLGADGIAKAQTMAFAAMAIFQLVNSMNIRSPRASVFSLGLLSNRWLVYAIALSLTLQIAAIHVPFLQRLFQTTPLTWIEWLLVFAVSSSVLWAEEIRKLVLPRLAD